MCSAVMFSPTVSVSLAAKLSLLAAGTGALLASRGGGWILRRRCRGTCRAIVSRPSDRGSPDPKRPGGTGLRFNSTLVLLRLASRVWRARRRRPAIVVVPLATPVAVTSQRARRCGVATAVVATVPRRGRGLTGSAAQGPAGGSRTSLSLSLSL